MSRTVWVAEGRSGRQWLVRGLVCNSPCTLSVHATQAQAEQAAARWRKVMAVKPKRTEQEINP